MELVELGTILEMTKGKKPITASQNRQVGSLPYVDIEAFETGKVKQYTDGEKCVPCEDGDVLIVCDGSRSGLVGYAIKGFVGSTLAKLTAEGVSNQYLYYFLQGKYALFNTKKKGTGTPHLNPELLKKQKLVIPSIKEQNRVVSRIEEMFSQLDAGVNTLIIIMKQMALYRLSVLQEAFANNELWEECKFGDLMTTVRNGYGKKPDDIGKYRILRIGAVRSMKLNLLDCRYNNSRFNDEDRISNNDLLFTRYNGSKEYVGVCARVPKIDVEYAYPDKIIKCTPRLQEDVHSKFLQYYVSQGDARRFIRSKIKTTSGQNGIAGSDIKKIPVRIPDIEIQRNVVEYIEDRLILCSNIEKTVEDALRQAEALKQSILKEAFEGRL